MGQHAHVVADLERRRVQRQIRGRLFSSSAAPVCVDRFEIKEKLGAGAMGVVYSAFDPQLQRDVAIKILSSLPHTQGDHFFHEARALARLAHPNVLPVFEVGKYEGTPYLVSELVTGGTLRQWLSQAQKPDWRQILQMLLQCAKGIASAHHLGLVHRDIKPDNILVGSDGRARVADFGLASLPSVHGRIGFAGVEQSGVVAGTVRYMAPEQLRGEHVDPLSDQFSFCVMAFEALFDRPPFRGDTIQQNLDEISTNSISIISASHPAYDLWAPLKKGLSSRPRDRFGSMDELVLALEKAAKKQVRRYQVVAAISAVLIVIVGISYAWVVARRAGGFSSNEERLVWGKAVEYSNQRKFAECVQVLVPFPKNETLMRLRMGCAQSSLRNDLILQACADWARHLSESPPVVCGSGESKARALQDQGKYRECLDVLEKSPVSTWSPILFSQCAKSLNTPEGYRRLCEYMKKTNPNSDPNTRCDKITHIH